MTYERCTCGKLCFQTWEETNEAIKKLKRKYNPKLSHYEPIAPYLCSICKTYHIGSGSDGIKPYQRNGRRRETENIIREELGDF